MIPFFKHDGIPLSVAVAFLHRRQILALLYRSAHFSKGPVVQFNQLGLIDVRRGSALKDMVLLSLVGLMIVCSGTNCLV